MSIPESAKLGRAVLVSQRPYYAAAIYRCGWHAFPELPTVAITPQWVICYGAVTQSWSAQQWATALEHEINHPLRHHPEREAAGSYDHALANIAQDCAINGDMGPDRAWPFEVVHPAKFGLPTGQAWEWYYDHLPKSAVLPRDCIISGEGITSDDGTPPVSPAEAQVIRKTVAEGVRAIGHAPEGLTRWAEAFGTPRVPWPQVLRATITHSLERVAAERTDYDRRRPNRRIRAAALPSLAAYRPHVAVVIDSSGSMSQRELSAALTELRGILAAVRSTVRVYVVDAAVQVAADIRDVGRLQLKGGGGTDMGVGIAAALDGRPRPDLIVVITDGWTPWPAKRPPVPVIVALVDAESRRSVPDWAKVVEVR